jgi:hypothetical protein
MQKSKASRTIRNNEMEVWKRKKEAQPMPDQAMLASIN